jgi:hypothetical protein
VIAPFAKLFDTADGQLLVYKVDSGDRAGIQVVGAPVGGRTPTAMLVYETVADRDANFDTLCPGDAAAVAAQLNVVATTAGGQGLTIQ